jgi:hypothetical protein
MSGFVQKARQNKIQGIFQENRDNKDFRQDIRQQNGTVPKKSTAMNTLTLN